LSEEDEMKEVSDKSVTGEAVRSLNEQLNESTFKSSTRIMILVLLTLARNMSAVQLRTLTGLGKGSLENHLNRLEGSGYVRLTYEKSLGARGVPRQMVEITEKGIDACRALVKSMSSLAL
jgi:DNA-binding PadR family transcriptional regulator